MRFDTKLQKGIFLRRRCANIIEVETLGEKVNVLCCNRNLLQNCAVLGSTIWYSRPCYLPFYRPAIWQLAEVDHGNLVLVNNYLNTKLFLEGFSNQVLTIDKLSPEKTLIIPDVRLFGEHNYDFNLFNSTDKTSCYVNFTNSMFNHDQEANNCNYFPEDGYETDLSDELYSLIHAKLLGHRAILFCFVCSQATDKLCITDKYNTTYAKLLKQALDYGVEFLAYNLDIHFNHEQQVFSAKVSSKISELYSFD